MYKVTPRTLVKHYRWYNYFMQIRTVTLADYDNLIAFWKENYFVGDMDELKYFTLFLTKNPNLSILIEEDNEIIGTALVSYDGRRGYLQKVVTKKDLRGNGIGKRLVTESIKKLKETGVKYIPLSAETELVNFYEKCGFIKKDSISMSIDL